MMSSPEGGEGSTNNSNLESFSRLKWVDKGRDGDKKLENWVTSFMDGP